MALNGVGIGFTTRIEGDKEALRALKAIQDKIEIDLEELSDKVSSQISYIIDRDRKRKGRRNRKSLANAFTPEKISIKGRDIEIGFGSVKKLDREFPYWAVVNYGGYIPRAFIGYFGNKQRPDPMLQGRGTEVFHQDNSFYLMKPQNPIRPMNYIEKTVNWLNTYWSIFWEKKLK